MAGSIEGIKASARQWFSDLWSGFEPARELELTELAQALNATPRDVSTMVGRLRDDDARANKAEMREAQRWLERARKQGAPTAAALKRYADDAVTARATLGAVLGSRPGIEAGEAQVAYRELLMFADRHPALSLRAITDAYLTVLSAMPIEKRRDGCVSRAWYFMRDVAGRGYTDTALLGTGDAFAIAERTEQDVQLAARIYASVLAYGSAETASRTTTFILDDLRKRYPAVPLVELADAWLALQSVHRSHESAAAAFTTLTSLVGEKPTPSLLAWMRAYTTIYRAEGDVTDTNAVLVVMAGAPPASRNNPELLATTYTTLLAANHDFSTEALHALRVLLQWAPPGLDLAAVARPYLALREVVGHREALGRTLYLLERTGSPARPGVLLKLTELEVAKARDSRTLLDRLGTDVGDLPQRVQGWWERARNTPGKAPPSVGLPPAPPASHPKAPNVPNKAPPVAENEDEDVYDENVPSPTEQRPIAGTLPAPIAPANTPEGLKKYTPGSVYRPGTPECIDLFERAAELVGVPKAWARSAGLHRILAPESRNGVVGIPNYTYGKNLTLDDWRRIHTDLKGGVITARSSATGLGQLLLRNVDVYYPAGRDGIGVPLQEAAGMLAYIHDRYGNPDNAWAQYGKRHEGY